MTNFYNLFSFDHYMKFAILDEIFA